MIKQMTLAFACALATNLAVADSAVVDNEINVGLLTDLEGIYSDLAGQGTMVAAEMAIEDFGGKLLGKEINLHVEHHNNDGELALKLAKKLHKEKKVDVFAELVSSGTAIPVQKYAKDNKLVTLIGGAASSSLTAKNCSPTGIHWAYDTYSLAIGTGKAIVQEGGKEWYFITADYAFGHSLQNDVSEVVKQNGGKVLGASLAPFKGTDFKPYIQAAMKSGAKIVGLANAGGDTHQAIRAAYEYGLANNGQSLAGLLMFLTDVRKLGIAATQGLQLTTGFYWNRDKDTRAWSDRFYIRHGARPTMVQASVYSSLTHYFKAVEAAGTDEATAVVRAMQKIPVNDFFAKNGKVREDGRMVHDMYLMRVKPPLEIEGAWDYLELVRVIPGDEAFRPISQECPHVAKLAEK